MSYAQTLKAPKTAIIGAGVAGVTCARRLKDAGLEPVVFEKSRGLGGRVATRRAPGGLCFDHGAQFMTARSEAFRAMIEGGGAQAWRPQRAAMSKQRGDPAGPWLVGAPAMNSFLKPYAADLDIRFGTAVAAVRPSGRRWEVLTAPVVSGGVFDLVICTAPAPQTKALAACAPEVEAGAAAAETAPCWAAMVAFETPYAPGFDVMRSAEGDLAWLARNASRPGRAAQPDGWVAHASPEWSLGHLEHDKGAVVKKLLGLMREALPGPLPAVSFADAHRWRYAMTTRPLGDPYAANMARTFFAAGDWRLGARVECAFESGAAAAGAVLETI